MGERGPEPEGGLDGGRAHHQGDHNGEAVRDLAGGLNQDDRETDAHTDDPAQESRSTNQGKGSRIDMAQSNVAGEERNQERALESYWGCGREL